MITRSCQTRARLQLLLQPTIVKYGITRVEVRRPDSVARMRWDAVAAVVQVHLARSKMAQCRSSRLLQFPNPCANVVDLSDCSLLPQGDGRTRERLKDRNVINRAANDRIGIESPEGQLRRNTSLAPKRRTSVTRIDVPEENTR